MDAHGNDQSRQVLTFGIEGQLFAFDVLATREVLFLETITNLPGAEDYMAGVINLRGSMVPVLSLRARFGLPPKERSVDTSVIIVELVHEGKALELGILVDQVHGVHHCPVAETEAPPPFGMKLGRAMIKAITRKEGAFVVILDPEKLLSSDETEAVRKLL